MLCAAAHQLAHTMPATVEADKRIKAMLYYCSMILRAYQSICSAEPRPGMGGWQGGSRAQSRALPRREWNGTGRAAGASAGEPPGTKENKAANPGLTPLIPATPAPAAPPPPSLSGFPLPHFLLFTMLPLRSRRRSLRYSRARAPPNPATLQLTNHRGGDHSGRSPDPRCYINPPRLLFLSSPRLPSPPLPPHAVSCCSCCLPWPSD